MDNGSQPLIKLDQVSKVFVTDEVETHALAGIHFEVHKGEYLSISGPSGCGKSTLLKAVGGFMAPVAGAISVRGQLVSAPGPDRMMVFQEFEQLMPWTTVLQNVMFPMSVTGKFSRSEARERALAGVGELVLRHRFQTRVPTTRRVDRRWVGHAERDSLSDVASCA